MISAAASGTPIRSWRRASPSGSTSTPTRSPVSVARRMLPTCASLPFPAGILRLGASRCSRSNTCRIRIGAGRGGARARAGRLRGVRYARTDSRSAARTRSSIRITTSNTTPRSCARCAQRFFARVEIRGLQGSKRYSALVDAEQRELDRLLALDPARLRRLVPRRARPVAVRLAPEPRSSHTAARGAGDRARGLPPDAGPVGSGARPRCGLPPALTRARDEPPAGLLRA